MSLRSIVFGIASGEQLAGAREVATHLESEAFYISPYDNNWGRLSDLRGSQRPTGFVNGMLPIIRAGRLVREVAQTLSHPPVFVMGQDMGYGERATIAAARRLGAPVALMPDGIVGSKSSDDARPRKPTAPIGDAFDHVVRASGLMVGQRERFASTEPEVILSWGKAWTQTWQERSPSSRVIEVGYPRADQLNSMGRPPHLGNLLLCSQPLFAPLLSRLREQAAGWYAWLERLSQAEEPRVRIRLHPAELATGYQLPPGLLSRCARSSSLYDDIEWADYVAAPFSSVLVDALAAGRLPVAVGDPSTWLGFADNALLKDSRLARIAGPAWSAKQTIEEAIASLRGLKDERDALRHEYLANAGTAACCAASALNSLART